MALDASNMDIKIQGASYKRVGKSIPAVVPVLSLNTLAAFFESKKRVSDDKSARL